MDRSSHELLYIVQIVMNAEMLMMIVIILTKQVVPDVHTQTGTPPPPGFTGNRAAPFDPGGHSVLREVRWDFVAITAKRESVGTRTQAELG